MTPRAITLAELDWLQNEFTRQLLTDKPDAHSLTELGEMIRRAERRCQAYEADAGRPILRMPR